jgi:hypothetical protein
MIRVIASFVSARARLLPSPFFCKISPIVSLSVFSPTTKIFTQYPGVYLRSSLSRARSVSETKEKGRASALCSRCHLHRRSAALAAPRYRRATEVPMANTDDDDDDENENEDEDGQ